ncbi:MAG: hypothetical protein AAF227_10235, partial [Pseudomonadota bacterium]
AFGLLLYPQKDIFFWAMTAGILGGLIFGLLMLGSKGFARLGFTTMRRIAPKKISQKPPNSSPTRNARSRFNRLPGPQADRFVFDTVSALT